jgi:hypothetical protein
MPATGNNRSAAVPFGYPALKVCSITVLCSKPKIISLLHRVSPDRLAKKWSGTDPGRPKSFFLEGIHKILRNYYAAVRQFATFPKTFFRVIKTLYI